jgi:pSer/pThr/pTyr-binding forkhead associated (FHA) protein
MDRLAGVLGDLETDAIDFLNKEMRRLNEGGRSRFGDFTRKLRRGWGGNEPAERPHRLAGKRWSVQFQEDPDGELDPGDVKVVTVLAPRADLPASPGTATQRIIATTRRLGVMETTESTVPVRPPASSRGRPVRAVFRYEDDSGRKEYEMTTDTIVIGRRAPKVHVDLNLQTSADVSREHARVRYRGGKFWIQDLSTFGTWVDGNRVESARRVAGEGFQDEDFWTELPDGSTVDLASIVKLGFEVRQS